MTGTLPCEVTGAGHLRDCACRPSDNMDSDEVPSKRASSGRKATLRDLAEGADERRKTPRRTGRPDRPRGTTVYARGSS